MDKKLLEIARKVIGDNPNGLLAQKYGIGYDWIPTEDILEEFVGDYNYGLRLCGCGNPDDTLKIIRDILYIQDEYRNSVDNNAYDKRKEQLSKLFNNNKNVTKEQEDNIYGLIQFVLYILDSKEFLEHGSSVGGAWLTEKGKNFLYVLDRYFEENC